MSLWKENPKKWHRERKRRLNGHSAAHCAALDELYSKRDPKFNQTLEEKNQKNTVGMQLLRYERRLARMEF